MSCKFLRNNQTKWEASQHLCSLKVFVKFWIHTTDVAALKKIGESKPSLKLTLKTKSYHTCGCCDDSRSCEQLKKHVTDKYYEKEVRIWTLITFCYKKYTLLLQYLSGCCLYCVYVWQKFRRKNISNWAINWIKFKVIWLR